MFKRLCTNIGLKSFNIPACKYVSKSQQKKCSNFSFRYFCTSKHDNLKALKNVMVIGEADPRLLTEISNSMKSQNLKELLELTEMKISKLKTVVTKTPTAKQLFIVGISPFPLFIAFGIIDNAVMIIAGEYFDITIGVMFGISTMAAAALGNLVSDILGLGMGGIVEEWFERLGWVKEPGLTRAQEGLAIVRRVRLLGSAIGITIGCLIGMFPLLFLDPEHVAKLKRQSKIDEIFFVVMDYIKNALKAEKTILYIVDKENGQVWTKKTGGSGLERTKIVLTSGPALESSRSGTMYNNHLNSTHILCSPIFDSEGETIGVIEIERKNKRFRVKDEIAVAAMASHISCALEQLLIESEDKKSDTESLLLALKASHDHYAHHLRYATERANGGQVALIEKHS